MKEFFVDDYFKGDSEMIDYYRYNSPEVFAKDCYDNKIVKIINSSIYLDYPINNGEMFSQNLNDGTNNKLFLTRNYNPQKVCFDNTCLPKEGIELYLLKDCKNGDGSSSGLYEALPLVDTYHNPSIATDLYKLYYEIAEVCKMGDLDNDVYKNLKAFTKNLGNMLKEKEG